MGTLWVDRWDEHSSAESDALVDADEVAQRIASEFGQAHESDRLAPEVAVRRDLGPGDQPLYDFRLNVDLPDDLASSEYPMDEIQDLASALRAMLPGTEVDRFRWLVSVGTKAGARAPMIQPKDLLEHARSLVPDSERRPREVDLRRGISAAYYSVFHYVTEKAAQHLIGSAPEVEQNKIRRTWSHGEISKAAAMIVDRAPTVKANPEAPLKKDALFGGPLVDLAASDAELVESLELFNELQTLRHQADYDHDATFEKVTYVDACRNARISQLLLEPAAPASREAFFALLTVLRPDFKER